MILQSQEFKPILALIDRAVAPSYLNPTQEIVLKETWNGKTYSQIAFDYNYESEYIKSVGSNLWKLLSDAFDEQINKSNFVPFIRQKIINSVKDKESKSAKFQSNTPPDDISCSKHAHWTTAPNTDYFIGREEELKTLKSWVQTTQCRCIIISGMVGCGKTILATKLAKDIENEFNCVIWFSLHQTPSLTVLIENYLNIFSKAFNYEAPAKFSDLSFLLSEFIECLKKYKILLILDGLENMLTNNKVNTTYKKQFENYGQLLRAIITTSHRSLLITTSSIKPTMLEYYSQHLVKSFHLQGFDIETTKEFFTPENNIILDDRDILSISRNLQNNPQLLKIVINQISDYPIENAEQILHDLSLLEGIINLLEQELSNLSSLSREIIYWLSISCVYISEEQLQQNIEQSHSTIKFLQNINYLLKRSLVVKNGTGYSLMPVMKTYLRRKLIKKSLYEDDS